MSVKEVSGQIRSSGCARCPVPIAELLPRLVADALSFSVFHRSRLFCGLGMGTQIQELTKDINRVLKGLSAVTGRKN